MASTARAILLVFHALLLPPLTVFADGLPEVQGLPVSKGRLEPCDVLFDSGVEAYHRGDWTAVILHMERALRNHKALRRARVHCRISCADNTVFFFPNGTAKPGEEKPALPTPPGKETPVHHESGTSGTGLSVSVRDLLFFQQLLRRADCLRTCEREQFGCPSTLFHVSQEVENEFQKRIPYNYLQMAYFKIRKLDKAVAAAYTFYVANPEHAEMRQNLEYYRMMEGVKESDFKDLEAIPHMDEFRLGVMLYTDEDFTSAADHFEKALEKYFVANEECRAMCEGPYDYEGYNYMDYNADLFQSVTDHYIQTLNCKQNCIVELSKRPDKDKPIEDFLPAHFNYLQFAYYNTENYEKAIECAKTYLLFHPNDEIMNQNVAYYSVVYGEEKSVNITPRERIQTYIRHSLREKELLFLAYDIFGITFVDPDTWTPEDVMPKRLREKQKLERETAARISEEIGNLMKEIETIVEEKQKESVDIAKMVQEGGPVLFDGIKVTMNSKTLNGSQRVVLDDVISDEECRELLRLANAASSTGDGYRGSHSPHTPNEKFHGVTVYKALKLGQEGKVPQKSAWSYYNVTEKARKLVESYFRLENPLYFSYSHLVCRVAVEDKQESRSDLSHPVHVDNCILNSEALDCKKESPAYTERDFSAILYLNDDFEGGNFIFTELDAKTVTANVRPQCGRLVGFSSGRENPHGVEAVTQGQRCAVALWFTLDPRHSERERVQSDDLVMMLFSSVDHEFLKEGGSKEPVLVSTSSSGKEGVAAINPSDHPEKTAELTQSADKPLPDSSSSTDSELSTESQTQDPTASISNTLESSDKKDEL
ncbi:prolyl 3-hydroxylase 1 [Protopterus annectens]|uniref:prolyl 3-hydroxylase 1 n=1 Tax=Protopterus annectens TaxID=7888 RepID=UPI001CFBA18B|nr:prolyl 3-hydroxylase 1 [Protopterus annectens]